MSEISKLFQISSTPGIRRDGTELDSDYFTSGQWVRWQRGRVKKMGGYRRITEELTGPVRASLVWSRSLMNALHTFSPSRIEATLMDSSGVGGSKYDRTPSGFVANDNHIWSVDTMYDDAVGSQGTIIVAVATNSLTNIDDTTRKQVYYGLAGTTDAFVPIPGLEVSGGVCAIAPYLIYYGSDGLVGWSDVNQPQTLNTGDAGQDRVTGSKIVKALPLRTGTGPGALLWSLDSLIAMTWVGGDAIFRFSTVSTQTSVLSQNGIIEYDGNYFWAGVDRFMVYAGGSVSELPNDNNLNWFFDNLLPQNRQKVWAMKIPRYGEIWWFFPMGEADECTHAVIYNLREKTWYDCELSRGSGFYSQVFSHPVMVSSTRSERLRRVTLTGSYPFNVGDSCATVTSEVPFLIVKSEGSGSYQVQLENLGSELIVGEGVQNLTASTTGTLTGKVDLYSAYVHEVGRNAVEGDQELAINSYFETSDFGLPTGGAQPNQLTGINRWTRLVRVEPDFMPSGEMTMEVLTREFAQSGMVTSPMFTFDSNTGKIDMREQGRQIRLRFSSNTLGGFFEMGRVILHTEPGDVRS